MTFCLFLYAVLSIIGSFDLHFVFGFPVVVLDEAVYGVENNGADRCMSSFLNCFDKITLNSKKEFTRTSNTAVDAVYDDGEWNASLPAATVTVTTTTTTTPTTEELHR